MASFSRFPLLPLELQREVWRAALQEGAPGLCIIFSSSNANCFPPLADVDLHVLMHVCHESRAMARAHFGYTLRRDSEGAFASREYRPDLDVLYIPTDRYDGFFDWRFLDSWPESKQPHHLAIDGHEAQLSRGGVGTQVAALVASGRLPHLASISLIFAPEPAPVPVYYPNRAYKLVDLNSEDGVWCALPGGCKYEDTDPCLIAEWWKASIVTAAGGRQLDTCQVTPKRIVVRRYANDPPKGWLSSTFGVTSRLRQILP
ncbi:hypothetical protein SCUP234_02492 [Seiridium cupressi]